MTYTVGTLFSGIGVPDLCARLLGMDTVWQVEKEAFPQAVLRKNFPEATLHSDVFDCHNLPYVDLIVAGFPCQPFSGAGKQLGDRDPRYLVPEMLRVIDEVRPRICLLENVPGFTSLDDGKSFKSLLGALAEMGLDAEWGHLRASDVGAPHQRERWFLVGYTSSERPGTGAQTGNGSLHDFERHAPQTQPGWGQLESGTGSCGTELGDPESHRDRRVSRSVGETQGPTQDDGSQPVGRSQEMGNADRAGRREQRAGKPVRTQQSPAQRTGRGSRTVAQPRLGRVLDGTAIGLDGFVPYPARPGEAQFAFEPPRVTQKTGDRAKRLKSLGNSMAVDVVFEIMRAVKLWLEAEDGAA